MLQSCDQSSGTIWRLQIIRWKNTNILLDPSDLLPPASKALRSALASSHQPDQRVRDDRVHAPARPPAPTSPRESYCLFIGVEQQSVGVNHSFCFCSSRGWGWGVYMVVQATRTPGQRCARESEHACGGPGCDASAGAARRSCTHLGGEETRQQLLLQRSLVLADVWRRRRQKKKKDMDK